METHFTPRINRARRRRFAVAAALLGTVAALFITEGALRLFNPLGLRERASWHYLLWEGLRKSPNPEKVWEHVPGYRRRLVGYGVRINSLGFRGAEVVAPKPAGLFRVLALGDSMTFGMSGAEENCYPEQLRRLLTDGGRPAEVVNAGVLGYTTLQEEAVAREAIPKLNPDLVILWWFHNDVALTGLANPDSQDVQLETQIGIKPHTLPRRLLHLGYLVAPCMTALIRSATAGRHDGDHSHFEFDPTANSPGWQANRASLIRIVELCRTSNTPLIVYTFGRYPEIESICRERGVPYLTTVDRAGREHEEKYAVAKVDPHFNREGNLAVARTLLPAVEAVMKSKRLSP